MRALFWLAGIFGWVDSELDKNTVIDVLAVNISDFYYGIALKLLMAYKLISCVCTNVKYVVKTDDDMYIRIPRLAKSLEKVEELALEQS